MILGENMVFVKPCFFFGENRVFGENRFFGGNRIFGKNRDFCKNMFFNEDRLFFCQNIILGEIFFLV